VAPVGFFRLSGTGCCFYELRGIPQQFKRRSGRRAALYDVAIRSANRAIRLKVLKGVKMEAVNRSFLEWKKPYTFERLSPDKVLRFAHNGEFEMTQEFALEALAKGDECFGFFCGEVLASYGWYSMRPTRESPGTPAARHRNHERTRPLPGPRLQGRSLLRGIQQLQLAKVGLPQ
jgi:hypothetical protein